MCDDDDDDDDDDEEAQIYVTLDHLVFQQI